MSKAGLKTGTLDGAVRTPEICLTSSGSRSSIGISAPHLTFVSNVDKGAVTKNGMSKAFAKIARPYVPILFAVSPFFAIRSAQSDNSGNLFSFIVWAAMLSVIRVTSMPPCISSQAVRREPCRTGLVSQA